MNCYREIPDGYVIDKVIDVKEDKKFAIGFNVAALFIAIVVGALSTILKFGIIKEFVINEIILEDIFVVTIASSVFIILYMVVHELVHGIAYKILTKEKLTFGITLSCAFCGVPNVNTTKKTSLITLLAPFTLFTIALIPMIIFLPTVWSIVTIIIFSMHIGGCIGDLYCTFLILFRYRGKKILVNDTGPKQTFYVYKEDQQ